MDGNTNAANGYVASTARQDARNMPLSTGSNGYPISAAMLMDPKSMKQHGANGINPPTLHPGVAHSSASFLRPQSEPPHLFPFPSDFDFTSHKSKDDAHSTLQGQARGRLSSNQTGPNQISPPRFDPRQLLNPKGFDPSQRSKDEDAHPSLSAPMRAPQYITDTHAEHPKVSHKRGHGEVERGMGSLIEQMHNVSKREDRPQKKQKREHLGDELEDEQRKAVFTGGGKGGDIGEYMKQKRREGQQDAGPTNTVVDLTAGTLFSWLTSEQPSTHALFRGR